MHKNLKVLWNNFLKNIIITPSLMFDLNGKHNFSLYNAWSVIWWWKNAVQCAERVLFNFWWFLICFWWYLILKTKIVNQSFLLWLWIWQINLLKQKGIEKYYEVKAFLPSFIHLLLTIYSFISYILICYSINIVLSIRGYLKYSLHLLKQP